MATTHATTHAPKHAAHGTLAPQAGQAAVLLPADEDGIRLPVIAAPSGHVRIDPRGWLTPDRFRYLGVLVMVLAIVFAALAVSRVSSGKSGFKEIGHTAGPQVVASSDLYLALNDMDAQLANVLLVGNASNLGITRQQVLGTFEQRRQQADRDLQQASALAGGDHDAALALRQALDGFGRYQALAGQAILLDGRRPHPAAKPPADAIAAYRQATDTMKQSVLPAAERLRAANADRVQSTFQQRYRALGTGSDAVLVFGIGTVGALVLLQVYLARRTRRVVNPALILATLIAVTWTASATTSLGSAASHLRVAKEDAFDSVLALTRARAIGWDANADESRYIVDPERQGLYQSDFYVKANDLVTVGMADGNPSSYQTNLQRTVEEYKTDARHGDHPTVSFVGYLGDEFRNITFPGEKQAAEQALYGWQAYQANDAKLRAMVNGGHAAQAVLFDTSPDANDSNGSFTVFDEAMAKVTAINQAHFDSNIKDGGDALSGWTVIPPVGAVVIIGLVLLGIRPRLAEYR